MNIEQSLKQAADLLTPFASEVLTPEPERADYVMGAESLRPAVAALVDAKWGYLLAITGMDMGIEAGQLEAIYHFGNGPAIASLRVRLPRVKDVSIESISDMIPPAVFFERELREMLGVEVNGLQDKAHLFLPDDWPDGVYPIRADFDPANASPVPGRRAEEMPEEGMVGNTFIVPIGPQHPALKEPGHFEFMVDGEVVTGARMRLGYAHRGLEKAAEARNWVQNLYLFERVCGICSHTHAMAYAMGVEKLAGVEIPARAQVIRQLMAGLERMHSHLLWLGVAAHEAGFDTLFMYSWRDREEVMNLLESVAGNRVNYSVNVLGGVKCDIGPEQAATIKKVLNYLEDRIRHYLEVVTTDTMFLQRTRGIGTISREEAERFGLLGPTARASGLSRDVRIEAPYGAYKRFPMSAVLAENGDLEARFVVRLKELLVSCFTMRMILDNMPEGELTVRVPRKIPAGETIVRVEAPRGELLYFIKSNGGETPARVHVRTPSLCNWVSVLEKAVGRQLADIPMLLSGMDPCFSCNDRMVTIRRTDNPAPMSWEELREYGIAYYNNLAGKRK